jgi:CBS domain-containing protein
MSDPDRKLLPIQVRRTVEPDARPGMELSVFCSRRGGSVALEDCLACTDCGGLHLDPSERNTFLMCRGSTTASVVPPQDTPASTTSARGEPTVATVMTANVVCVSPELSLDALTLLMLERGISGVPVVDQDGVPLGVVSKTDLLRRDRREQQERDLDHGPLAAGGYEFDLGPGFQMTRLADEIVEDVMMPMALTVPENAPISRAAALMAQEGVHRLVVVAARSGVVVGILSAIDLLRWMAREHGYAVPLASEREPSAEPDESMGTP